MIAKKWFNITNSYDKARRFHEKLDAQMTPEEKLDDIFFCRRQYFILNGLNPNKMSMKKVFKISKRI
ncbi:MAG: hypothetical protein LHV68_10720 [Elusimicrobia bacterium]|nr:hypothetical protein [Candidatus Liberimonas magnetica]